MVSVANLTRKDGEEFLQRAAGLAIQTSVKAFELSQVNTALDELRNGKFTGAAVIKL